MEDKLSSWLNFESYIKHMLCVDIRILSTKIKLHFFVAKKPIGVYISINLSRCGTKMVVERVGGF